MNVLGKEMHQLCWHLQADDIFKISCPRNNKVMVYNHGTAGCHFCTENWVNTGHFGVSMSKVHAFWPPKRE